MERARTAKQIILSHTNCREEDIGFIIGDDAKFFTAAEKRRKDEFLTDINKHASECKYLIVSPSITVGNSIDLGLDGCDLPNPFHRTVALIDAIVMCWEDLLQQIFRVRYVQTKCVEVVCFHIKDRSSELEPLPPRRNPADVFHDMAYPEKMNRMLQT